MSVTSGLSHSMPVRKAKPSYTKPANAVAAKTQTKGLIKLLTCGSVDDGKSTLIGRLLWDASHLHDDLRERLLKNRADSTQRPDFSRLVDGLVAEQEQGITIDICWHYFDTPSRRVVVIDSPGHEQYTRNMATGASHADVGVVLVDAQSGVKRQTRRHLAILDLAGVRQVVLAVNKMDLVDWSEERFRAIETDFAVLVARYPGLQWTAIPVAALSGANIVQRASEMPWYGGPTLAAHLDQVQPRADVGNGEFRMPVQMVLRGDSGFRGLAGSVTSGAVSIGDDVRDVQSGKVARVVSIETMDGPLTHARAGQAITLELSDHLDIGRGGMMAAVSSTARAADAFAVRLVWLADHSFTAVKGYLIQTMTDLAPVVKLQIQSRLDLDTLDLQPAHACGPNDIVDAHLTLARSIAADTFANQRDTGAFFILDALTGAVVAGGSILAFKEKEALTSSFVLTREMLDHGLCAAIPIAERDGEAYRRLATEAAILLTAAGVDVTLDLAGA